MNHIYIYTYIYTLLILYTDDLLSASDQHGQFLKESVAFQTNLGCDRLGALMCLQHARNL